MNTATRTRTGTRTNSATQTLTVDDKINAFIISSFFATGALVGLWSFAAFVGGMVAAGGPLNLAKGYFMALAGI